MFKSKVSKLYTSEIDTFFHEFDKKREFTQSRIDEVEKFKKIFEKRDNKSLANNTKGIWEDF